MHWSKLIRWLDFAAAGVSLLYGLYASSLLWIVGALLSIGTIYFNFGLRVSVWILGLKQRRDGRPQTHRSV